MHWHRKRIHKSDSGFTIKQLLIAHFLEQAGYDARLNPTLKTFVNRMPFAILFGQPPPLAAVFAYVQQGIDEVDVFYSHVPTLFRQFMLDFVILLLGYLHAYILSYFVSVG